MKSTFYAVNPYKITVCFFGPCPSNSSSFLIFALSEMEKVRICSMGHIYHITTISFKWFSYIGFK